MASEVFKVVQINKKDPVQHKLDADQQQGLGKKPPSRKIYICFGRYDSPGLLFNLMTSYWLDHTPITLCLFDADHK